MYLNLFCNRHKLDNGWINVDCDSAFNPDVVADLELRWPWDDHAARWIRAYDGPEHISDSIHFMNEAWRVLGPDGILELWVPSTDGRGAFQDPTHKSFWNLNSFGYYAPGNLKDLYPKIQAAFQWVIVDNNDGFNNRPSHIIHMLAVGKAIKSDPCIPFDDEEKARVFRMINKINELEGQGVVIDIKDLKRTDPDY